jgi:hypothetical protein
MNFAAVFELAIIVAFVVILAGGKQKRERGWKLLATMLVVVGVVQCGAMALVVSDLWDIGFRLWKVADNLQAYTYDNYDRFVIPGFTLGTSWILCTVSWTIAILAAVGVIVSAFVFPPEDGYEFIG